MAVTDFNAKVAKEVVHMIEKEGITSFKTFMAYKGALMIDDGQMVQLMKIDGQVFKSEIVFCEDIAQKLGYKKGVVGELSSRIFSDPSITADRDLLKKKALKYLK